MKPYLISLGAGLLVGVIYSLLGVRSPAPPMIALVGLLGILVGEQAIPLGKRLLAGDHPQVAWLSVGHPHVFGRLPTRAIAASPPPPRSEPFDPLDEALEESFPASDPPPIDPPRRV